MIFFVDTTPSVPISYSNVTVYPPFLIFFVFDISALMILVYSSVNFFQVLLLSEYFNSGFIGVVVVTPVIWVVSAPIFLRESICTFFIESSLAFSSFTLLFATRAESAFNFPLKSESLRDFFAKQLELINNTRKKNKIRIV